MTQPRSPASASASPCTQPTPALRPARVVPARTSPQEWWAERDRHSGLSLFYNAEGDWTEVRHGPDVPGDYADEEVIVGEAVTNPWEEDRITQGGLQVQQIAQDFPRLQRVRRNRNNRMTKSSSNGQ